MLDWAGGWAGAVLPRWAVTTPLGTQLARFWVDKRRRVDLVGWDMHTRSGRGGRGRVRREVGVRFDGSTGE